MADHYDGETGWYDLMVTDALPISPDALDARDDLDGATLNADEQADLEELDQILVEEALRGEPTMIMHEVLADHPDKPIEQWWWHLGRIRRGGYPMALLPAHVRQVLAEAGRA